VVFANNKGSRGFAIIKVIVPRNEDMKKLDKTKNIGDLLIEYRKITMEDLEEALRLQKEFNLRIGETLIKLGKVTKDDIEWVLSKQLDIPFVIVENINLDPKLISKFSEELLLGNSILPLYETDEEIAIATDEPLNQDVFESMEGFVRKKIKLSSGNGEKIRGILTQFFKREGVPALIKSIKSILEKVTGTSFYRIDFIVGGNNCEINAYGFGILKNIELLSESYTREQVFE
jgi:type IV pilus assembly protein PilB